MKRRTIEKLCCPFDKNDLTLQVMEQDVEGSVLKGILHCEKCNRSYPIVHGVPIMTPDEYREQGIEQRMLG